MPGYDFHVTERPMSHADAQLILTQLVRANELLERLVTRLDTHKSTPSGKKRDTSQSSDVMQLKHQIADAFIDELLEFTGDPNDVIATAKIYAEYLIWYSDTEPSTLTPLELISFSRYLTQHGAGKPLSALVVDGQKVRVRTGVRFK